MTILYNILKLKDRRIALRTAQTPQEIILWAQLRGERLGVKFRRQHGIGGYIADFYCPSKKLIIEIDGFQHFTKEAQEYDNIRSSYFKGLGVQVLRFTNAEVNTNMEGVLLKITSNLDQ